MTESELLESLIYSTRHAAGFVLKRYRRVLPFCVQFAPAEDPLVDFYFPREAQPEASFEEQYALAEAKARRFALKPETCALSLVTEVIQGEQRVMVVQAETRTLARLLHYPIRKTWLGWTTGEPREAEGLLVGRLLG
jgi:hypothetical protein